MATVQIPLTRGKVAIVDDSDAAAVLAYKWQAVCRRGLWYARRSFQGKRIAKGVPSPHKTIYLHVFIMKPPAGHVVDHKDGVGLNCRRENMRSCTQGQNVAAMKTMNTNTSGFRGVRHDNRNNPLAKRWEANITHQNRHRSLGRFATAEEAARAYDSAATELFGEFAQPNFPPEPPSNA